MPIGYLSLVLHAHLPFVRDNRSEEVLEERWFFEACTECYIPLLKAIERLEADGVRHRLTFSLSPTLISMMKDDLLKEKYLKYLDKLIQLGTDECCRTAGDDSLNSLARLYLGQLEEVRIYFFCRRGDLTAVFRELRSKGCLELITTAATHGYLPLVHSREARRAQIEVGIDYFQKAMGHPPPGFWIPECAYVEGLDVLLKEAGIKYFLLDTHGILTVSPGALRGVFAPVQCRSGVAAFGRDPSSSRQVWERRGGYPGHPDYREFYRDIGYDLELGYLGDYLPCGNLRVDTGFKYYRITGEGDKKEVYRPDLALSRVKAHALDFVLSRERQVDDVRERVDRPPVVVAPYDAELFGHWWYEGPLWLEEVCRQSAMRGDVRMQTPGDYLRLYPENQVVDLTMSSWGQGGFNYVWLNPSNDWIYSHQHVAEDRMVELADMHRRPGAQQKRALNQAARELLLAQSSDWAFIINAGTTALYASNRVAGHLDNFLKLADQAESGRINEETLVEMEKCNNIFPDIDYSVYRSRRSRRQNLKSSRPGVLMLSWEYPPRTIGGLARHVHNLSRALSRLGADVHVLTCPARGKPEYEVDDMGVRVYRVPLDNVQNEYFMDWLVRLNNGMVELAGGLGLLAEGKIGLIHAHDWLVRDAAREMVQDSGKPLVVTMHATEYGRNRGIFTDLQRQIHGIEGDLVAMADLVIGCSNYMAIEIMRLFGKNPERVKVIPNGVDARDMLPVETSNRYGDRPRIAFLGRLVPEKGVQVIIEALPEIREKVPDISLVVAGRGPYEDELRKLADRLGVSDCIDFRGFVNDAGRNELLANSSAAVFPSLYEPFGIVALEAMAARVPVIVSETGGLSEIIDHGIDGFKILPGRADQLAFYVTEIVGTPQLARRITEKAYRKVLNRYDWNHIAMETGAVYLEVISTGQNPYQKNIIEV